MESFQQAVYEKAGIHGLFPQDNHSYSQQGCIRGMHFQYFPETKQHGQAKLIRVAVGKIYDVAVDLRFDSPTFGQWEGIVLDDLEHKQLYVPEGFAHGFCVLSPEAHVMYKVSRPYDPKYEMGFRWNDPAINIAWPTAAPLISERDQAAPTFNDILRILKGEKT